MANPSKGLIEELVRFLAMPAGTGNNGAGEEYTISDISIRNP
jgi:hypothetical protein